MKTIFIIGSPRSGTSLLYYLLCGAKNVAYPDIALARMLININKSFLYKIGFPVFQKTKYYSKYIPKKGELKHDSNLHFLNLDPILPYEGGFIWNYFLKLNNLNIDKLAHNKIDLYKSTIKKLRSFYNDISIRTNQNNIIDKSPKFTVILDYVKKVFPNAYIIHIIRYGRAVINSISYAFKYRKQKNGKSWDSNREWWGTPPPNCLSLKDKKIVEKACHQWNYYINEGKKAKTLFDNYFELKYEDLITEPNTIIEKIYDFSGLKKDSSIVYPSNFENKNYKWKESSDKKLFDELWTQRSSIEINEYPLLEIIRDNLLYYNYIEDNQSIID